MSSVPSKNPSDPMTPEQKIAMASEIADLRLRAEHELLTLLVLKAGRGQVDAGEAAAALIALSGDAGSAIGAVLARAFSPRASRR